MTDAAFKACYAEWKVIKTRAMVQLVFEIPIEKADEAYQVLGGMPIAAHEVWCGIARLAKGGDASEVRAGSDGHLPVPEKSRRATQPRPVAATSAGADKQRQPFGTLPYSTQAAIRCNDPIFRAFLREMCGKSQAIFPDGAAEAVRQICEVGSRKDIKPGTEAETHWLELESWFDAWKTKERVA